MYFLVFHKFYNQGNWLVVDIELNICAAVEKPSLFYRGARLLRHRQSEFCHNLSRLIRSRDKRTKLTKQQQTLWKFGKTLKINCE